MAALPSYRVFDGTWHRFVSRDDFIRIHAYENGAAGEILWGGDGNGHFSGAARLGAADFEALILFCNGLWEAQNAVAEE